MSLLSVRDLHVWYSLPNGSELHAVRGIDFDLDAGERLGLVGESGSGKTTAVLSLMGLLPSSASLSGEILLGGSNIVERGESSARPHRWSEIAMVFQGAMNALNPVKRIGWQIAEPMLLHDVMPHRDVQQRVAQLLEQVELPAATAQRYPHELSGGQRQRVSIAMALSCNPKVLLADEPTTALDVLAQAQILELLRSLSDKMGLALIFVTHDLPVVAQVCHRVSVMYAGEIVEEGTTDELYHDALHPYTRRLFEATPDLHARSRATSIPGVPPRLDEPIRGCAFEPRCDFAFDKCALEAPALLQLGNSRRAACHLNVEPEPVRSQLQKIKLRVESTSSAEASDDEDGQTAIVSTKPERTALDVRDLRASFAVRRPLIDTLTRKPGALVRAVDGLSLHLQPGELVALIGESGCGKSTTAQAILRMIEPTDGAVSLNDVEITHMPERRLRPLRHRIQMIYQDSYDSLDPRFRVRNIVEEALIVNRLGGGRASRQAKVIEALEQVELSPAELYMDRFPHELSGGQRQRVSIASALVVEPDVLVADEPVSMLDVSVRAGVLALLNRLRLEKNLAILMITHDLSTVANFADRVAVMYLGRIVEEGKVREVIDGPRHPYTRALLAVAPRRDPCDRTSTVSLGGEVPNPINMPSGCHFHPRCPIAEQQCREIDPVLHLVADDVDPGSHRVACLLA